MELWRYKDLTFIEPNVGCECYVQYKIGWFRSSNGDFKNKNDHPNQPNTIPLIQTASDILGLPFKEVINSLDNTFKSVSEISKKFSEIIDLNDDKRVFSCGSGITACVLGLAYSLVNNTYSPTVYDGSWAEYGRI